MEKLATYIVREGALATRNAAGWIVRLCLTLEPHHASGVAHGRVSAKGVHIESPSCGSRGFLLEAPDLVDDPAYFSLDRASGGVRSPESDTWAVGVTFYFALTGALPFAGTTPAEVRDRLQNSIAAPLAVFDAGDDELQQIVDELFSRNRDERLVSLAALRERLIRWDATLAELPALSYGRPDELYGDAIGDDSDDDDDHPMALTSVAHRMPQIKAEILAEKERRERSADRPPPPQSEADLQPPGGTLVLDKPDEPRIELGKTLTSEPDKLADVPDLGRTLVMSEQDELDETQIRRPRGEPPRPPLSRRKVRTPFADTLPAAAVPPAGREALARALGKPSPRVAATAELPPAVEPTVDSSSPPPARPAAPAPSGIISSEIPSALELLARPDSTPPPPPPPTVDSPPLVPVAPPRRRRGSFFRRLLVCLLLVGAGYVTFRFYGTAIWRAATRIVPALRRMEKTPPPAAPEPTSAPAAPPVTASSPLPEPSARAPGVQSCVDPLFAAGAFKGERDLDFLCTETQPAKGAASLHQQIDPASDAAKEWSELGWYDMAVFAIARARCCKDAPLLATPSAVKECALDESLKQLAEKTFEPNNEAAEQALFAYTRAAQCLSRNGAAQSFGQDGAPRDAEVASFKKSYERARRLIPQK